MSRSSKLREIFSVFLKLGFVAFGGPAAHVALMQDEFVERRQWMSAQRFTSLLGITNLIPGPNSTEMAMLCGYERGGFSGFLTAGVAFISPAMVMTIILAYVYVSYGSLPALEPVLIGLQAGVVVVIVHAVYKLSKKMLKDTTDYVLLAVAILFSLFLLDEIVVILLTGALLVLSRSLMDRLRSLGSIMTLSFVLQGVASQKTSAIFLFFLKIGAVLFGSGYVLVAYLDTYLVQDLGWITRTQLLDAIAIGQFTPGPVLTTASFIGYLLNGVEGAIAATIGIFLPSFVFVAIIFPIVEKISRYKQINLFITGAGIGALAVMAVVAVELVGEGIGQFTFIAVLVVAAIYQFGYKKANTIITIILSIALSLVIAVLQ
ncbi:MAG: chromate efflux transporter [Saprospiraceae bacterium]|nr:chromate efflux transporter [Saprospiraceae bacterium]